MSMIYKRYELSRSLNGTTIVHIARNTAGNVIFREPSEEKLKKAIDAYLEHIAREEELAAKKSEETIQEEEVATLPPQARVTRGPDGKFISKSLFQKQESFKNKTFWDKLKG